MITTYQYDRQAKRLMTTDVAPLACPVESEGIIWVDLLRPTAQEVEQVLRLTFGIHPLAIEDALKEGHPPKLEDHDAYLQIILHGIRADARQHRSDVATAPAAGANGAAATDSRATDNGSVTDQRQTLSRRRSDRQRKPSQTTAGREPSAMAPLFFTAELSAFIGSNFLITVHQVPIHSLDVVRTRLQANPIAIQKGPDFLFHKIIDDLIDNYFPILDGLADQVEKIETEVFDCPTALTLPTILRLKRDVNRLRRIVVQEKEVLHLLSRGDAELITDDERLYYRDVYDHLVRITDLTESYRDQLGSVLDAYLSVNANRTTDVMKVLTIIATIFIPLTFIAGVYGMNFDTMPELRWRYGYPAALTLMLATAIGFLVYFRRKEWI